MTQPALRFESLEKTYPNGVRALKGVTFDVEEGEFFGLLGPNGAGKTTLITSLAGLTKPTAGRIVVRGIDRAKNPRGAARNLGIVPQEITFDPFLTVRETLRYQSGYWGIAKNDDWIDEILENLGLIDKAEANVRALSGGMKRRVLVAQALVHKPPVIVLDEPTAGVDVELRENLWTFIGGLHKKGHTIVLTTHYLAEAQALCRRVAILKEGRIARSTRRKSSSHGLKAGFCVAASREATFPRRSPSASCVVTAPTSCCARATPRTSDNCSVRSTTRAFGRKTSRSDSPTSKTYFWP